MPGEAIASCGLVIRLGRPLDLLNPMALRRSSSPMAFTKKRLRCAMLTTVMARTCAKFWLHSRQIWQELRATCDQIRIDIRISEKNFRIKPNLTRAP
jgi:hypothetical protein